MRRGSTSCVQDILDSRRGSRTPDAAPTQLRRHLRDAVLRRADFRLDQATSRAAPGWFVTLRDSVQLYAA